MLFGKWCREQKTGEQSKVAVAHDARHGARALFAALTAGLQSVGAEVHDLGHAPSGPFSVYMARRKMDGGLLAIGSHLPWDRIGLIPLHGDGRYCGRNVTDELERGIPTALEQGMLVPLEHMGGNVWDHHASLVRTDYLPYVLEWLDRDLLVRRGFKVFLDPGNGTAGHAAGQLFGELGCTVRGINLAPDARPKRVSECRADNCRTAASQARKAGSDLCLCFDGDADRVLFIDEAGQPLPDRVVAAIFAKRVLRPGDVWVTPINASPLTRVLADELSVCVVPTRIGQPSTGQACLEHRASFVHEEAASKFGFPKLVGNWYDGIFAGAMMLQIMARESKPLSELAAEVPAYYEDTRGGGLPADWKDEVVERAGRLFRSEFSMAASGSNDQLDGIWFMFADGSEVGMRASGTEPKWRIHAYARTQERARDLAAAGERCWRRAIRAVRV